MICDQPQIQPLGKQKEELFILNGPYSPAVPKAINKLTTVTTSPHGITEKHTFHKSV